MKVSGSGCPCPPDLPTKAVDACAVGQIEAQDTLNFAKTSSPFAALPLCKMAVERSVFSALGCLAE
jgi:hypothetical protein